MVGYYLQSSNVIFIPIKVLYNAKGGNNYLDLRPLSNVQICECECILLRIWLVFM